MKKTILSLALLALIGSTAMAQNDDAPAAVKSKFAADYPNVKKVKWEKEDGHFEAEFEVNGVETSVVYDASGKKLETETAIEVSALPKAASDYIATKYPGQKVKEAAKITDASGKVTYEAEVKEGDLMFDANGHFIELKSEKGKEKDEEDD